MRAAPAVVLPMSPARLERLVIVLLHAVAGLAAASVMRSEGDGPGLLFLALGAGGLGAVGAVVARRLLPIMPHRLGWTGRVWQLDETELAWQVDLQIDAGHWLLLSAQAAGRRVWLVAQQSHVPAQWHGLRMALWAHAGRSTQP